jgi:hypothetical protein
MDAQTRRLLRLTWLGVFLMLVAIAIVAVLWMLVHSNVDLSLRLGRWPLD